MQAQRVEPDRNKVMADIAASRATEIAKELGSTGEPAVEFEPAPEDPKPAEAPPAATPTPAVDVPSHVEAAPVVAAPEPIKTVRVKVYGEEFDVPQTEIDKAGSVAIYQMERAAEIKLKKLDDTQKQVDEYVKKLQEPPKPPVDPDEENRKTVRAIQFGSEEEALEAVKKLTKPADLPVNQIVETAVRRMEWDKAVKDFAGETADLLKDPDIQVIAISRENQLKQAIQQTGKWPTDIAKFYKDLSADLRTKFGKPTGLDLEGRREKKEALAEPTTAAGKVPAAPEVKTKTASEIINETRKSRGQKPL